MPILLFCLPSIVVGASWDMELRGGFAGILRSELRSEANVWTNYNLDQYVAQYHGSGTQNVNVPRDAKSAGLNIGWNPGNRGNTMLDLSVVYVIPADTNSAVHGVDGSFKSEYYSSERFSSKVLAVMPGIKCRVPISDGVNIRISAHAGGSNAWVNQDQEYIWRTTFANTQYTARIPLLGWGLTGDIRGGMEFALNKTFGLVIEGGYHYLRFLRMNVRKNVDRDGDGVIDYTKGGYIYWYHTPDRPLHFDYSGWSLNAGISIKWWGR
jgi:hypothetical protein